MLRCHKTAAPAEAPRSMFMDAIRFDAGAGLVHLGLMDNGPDGVRPEVDGPTLAITLPLDQFAPIMGHFAAAIAALSATRWA